MHAHVAPASTPSRGLGQLSDAAQQLLGLAGLLITGLFTLVSVLVAIILRRTGETNELMKITSEGVQPISDGYASETTGKLDSLMTQSARTRDDISQIKQTQGTMCRDIQALYRADSALLDLINERQEGSGDGTQ